jgi:hypothetical protein
MPPADHPAGAPAPGASPSAFGDAFTEPLKAAMSFGKFMPGFDFLEQWTRQAHAAMPSMGQWVAPTLDPAELDKRIQDLRTVQFWLEQNARMLGITIQALEVQRMTLATLQGMNVPVDALRESLKARPAASPASPAAGTPFSSAATQAGAWPGAGGSAAGSAGAPGAASAAEPAAPTAPEAGAAAVDPMRWWGALTQQFTQLAASTMQDALRPDRGTPDAASGTAPGAPAEAAPAPPPAAPAAPTSASGDDAPRPPRGKARGTSRDR